MRALWLSSIIMLAACGGPQSGQKLLDGLPKPGDAPYELADDDDLDAQRARYDALGKGPERTRLRRRLAGEYARRINAQLENRKWDRAYAALQRMVGLFTATELAQGVAARDLARHRPTLARVRSVFARAGADHQAGGALFALATIDPANSKKYLAEVDEMFAYADDLNVAEYGDGAQRARPIEILEGISAFLPSPEVVNRLVELYIQRQKALDSRIRRRGADFNLIRAHGASVVRTAWHLTALLAKADRLDEAPLVTGRVVGIGDDPDLRKLLGAALSPNATARSWIELANYYHSDEKEKSDPEARLAILEAALARKPQSPALHIAAGNVAFSLERIPLAVRYFEGGLAKGRLQRRSASERLAALYETQVITLALGARVRAATVKLEKFEQFHRRAAESFGKPIKPDLADAYAAMGQGLVSLGDLERAKRYLERSVVERPTFTALEFLGTIEFKRERHQAASAYFDRALKLTIETDRQHFIYNRLLRLSGQAALGRGEAKRATAFFDQAVKRWEQVLSKYELTNELLADLLLETGKIQWAVGSKDSALVALGAALNAVPDNESVFAEVVAFLVGRGMYREALDAYHRALENANIGDEIKVYMSLWMLAEAKYGKRDPDPFAAEFVSARKGNLWQDALARYATGRLSMDEITPMATTRRRQSELLFYGAVIHEVSKNPARARELLERVKAGNMLLDFEYELAKRWLRRRLGPAN